MFFTVEQVKGPEEMKEKIIAAAREARSTSQFSHLPHLPDVSNSVCDNYLNYRNNHVQRKGMCRPINYKQTAHVQ